MSVSKSRLFDLANVIGFGFECRSPERERQALQAAKMSRHLAV